MSSGRQQVLLLSQTFNSKIRWIFNRAAIVRNERICVNGSLKTLDSFSMLALFPEKTGMLNGC
jgi:hypothetical protein